MAIYKIFRTHTSMENLELAYIPPDSPWYKNRLKRGEDITDMGDLPITYIYTHNSELGDYPPTTNGGMLVSGKFAKLLGQLTKKYKTFPTEVFKDEKMITSDYITFVFTSKYSVIDWENSLCDNFDGKARNIKKIVLLNDKIKKIPDSEKIFRMAENTNWILVTEEAKVTIEDAGIQDVGFKEIEVI